MIASSTVRRVQGDAPLVATKLAVPLAPLHYQVRDRLAEQLDRVLDDRTRLVLVAAPPGYGKTVAVAGWLASRRIPCAWLSLESADDDLGRFLRYLTAAIAPLRPSAERACTGLLGPGASPSPQLAAATLLDAISASDGARSRASGSGGSSRVATTTWQNGGACSTRYATRPWIAFFGCQAANPRRPRSRRDPPIVRASQPRPRGGESEPRSRGLGSEVKSRRNTGDRIIEVLTPRELDVLRQLAEGARNVEIADALGVSPGTARWHVANVLAKLGERSRARAVSRARALGIV